MWSGAATRVWVSLFDADGSVESARLAPVAARLRSYRVALPAEAAAYVETIYQWPAFRRWYQAALQEVQG